MVHRSKEKTVSDDMVTWLITTTSCGMDRRVSDRVLKGPERKGDMAVRLFLDYVMFDSVSPEVRRAFVESFMEQVKK